MQSIDMKKYLGVQSNVEIIDTTGFDTLSPESVFIKQELTIVMPDGVRIPLANTKYLEFYNSPEGREAMLASDIDQKLKDAILMVWGINPVLENKPKFI